MGSTGHFCTSIAHHVSCLYVTTAAILQIITQYCVHYLIQSTPRDEEEAVMRATPGVMFQGHQRPSTVTGQVADNKEVMSFLIMNCIWAQTLSFRWNLVTKLFKIFSMTLLQQSSPVRGISLQSWHQEFKHVEKVITITCKNLERVFNCVS